MNSRTLQVGLAMICVVAAMDKTRAASGSWVGTTSTWTDSTNWSASPYPGSSPTDVATFSGNGSATPTLGSGTLTLARLVYLGDKNYTITGAGASTTSLILDPNTASSVNFITATGTGTATDLAFSNLKLVLSDSNLSGQTKLLLSGGRSVTIASNAALELGKNNSQGLIVEKSGTAAGSASLNVNGVLTATTAATVLMADTGVVNLNHAAGSDLTNLQITAGNGGTGTVNLLVGGSYNGASLILGGNGADINIAASGITVSNASFVFATTGTTTMGATYTSGTSGYSGAVTFGTGTAVKRNVISVASGAQLDLSGSFNGGGTNTTVEKSGNGVLNLNRAAGNTFTAGSIAVTAGTLLVNNTSNFATGTTAPVNVSSGATLGGTGILGGAVTVSGIVAPGNNSIGTLTIANDITWNGGAVAGTATDWKFELGASNAADLLNITGTASEFLKGTDTVFRFDFQGSTALGTFKVVDWASTASVGGGTLGTSFNLADFSYTNLGAGHIGTFQFNGTQLEFVAAVPEPATWALVTMAGMCVLFGWRRKASRRV